MRIALVYDKVVSFGGAERILQAFSRQWPQVPLYTARYDSKAAWYARKWNVIDPSGYVPPLISRFPVLTELWSPYVFESFTFDDFDIVISLSGSFSKAVITKPHTFHLCYCLTPVRYLWSGYREYLREPGFGRMNGLVRKVLSQRVSGLRQDDYGYSRRPDAYLAISWTVSERIRSYYRISCDVIHPPVDIHRFRVQTRDRSVKPYYLVVSRLVSYKRIDLIIQTCLNLGLSLKIVGRGNDQKRLKKIAEKLSGDVEFISEYLTDEKLCWYYQNCTALFYPAEEDFGISAVEAQACGRPVIGYSRGGISEIVLPGVTGELYKDHSIDSVKEAVIRFTHRTYSSKACMQNAERFSESAFISTFSAYVEKKWAAWKRKNECDHFRRRGRDPSMASVAAKFPQAV